MLDRRDVYLTTHRTAQGWGGAWTRGTAIHLACRARGLSTLLLGTTSAGALRDPIPPDASQLDAPVDGHTPWWRLRHWFLVPALERFLRRLPPPRIAFVGMTMHWVIAAKQTWPETRVIYNIPCFLTLCLPYTWPQRHPPTLWSRLDFLGIRRAEQRALAMADTILGGTPHVSDEVRQLCPAAVERVDIRTYGPPPSDFAPELREQQRANLGLDADTVLFLAAGLLDRNKALDFAVEALRGVDRRGHLVIVGDGPQHDGLLQQVRRRGLLDRIHLPGPQPDMRPWYAAADVVVSTSHYDMYPNTIQEGWAFGRPALVPQDDPPQVYAGAAAIVEALGGGLTYDRRHPTALTNAMNRLLHDRELYAALARQALAVAERNAGWDRCVDAILGQPSRPGEPASTATVAAPRPAPAGTP